MFAGGQEDVSQDGPEGPFLDRDSGEFRDYGPGFDRKGGLGLDVENDVAAVLVDVDMDNPTASGQARDLEEAATVQRGQEAVEHVDVDANGE